MWWSVAYAATVVGDFTAVEIDAPCTLELVAGNRGEVELSYTGMLGAQVVGRVLEVRGHEVEDCVLRGTHVGLDRVAAAGEATVRVDRLTGDATVIALGASSIVIGSVQAGRFVAQLAGASALTVEGGGARLARLRVTGSSVVDAPGLKVERGELSVATSSQAEVWVAHVLDAHVVGASTLRYRGTPTQRAVRTDGTSRVETR